MLSIFPQLFFLEQLAPFLLRLALGVIFIAHGYQKLFGNLQGTADSFHFQEIRHAKAWAVIAGALELAGGVLLLAGFLTQLGAILAIIDRLGAISRTKFKKGFIGGYELDLALIAMAAATLVLGPGFFSIDL